MKSLQQKFSANLYDCHFTSVFVDTVPFVVSKAEHINKKPFYVGTTEVQWNKVEAVLCYLLWVPGFRIDDKLHLALLDVRASGLQDSLLVTQVIWGHLAALCEVPSATSVLQPHLSHN